MSGPEREPARPAPGAHLPALDAVNRRRFLELMGASLALAGVAGCDVYAPTETIVPYAHPPERVVPGRPLFFATTFERSGYGRGVLVESHMGRPTKVEGNPDHPASLGASDVFGQAEVLNLYDPERSRVVLAGGHPATWSALAGALRAWLEADGRRPRSRLRVLSGPVSSPTLLRQLAALLERRPGARWHVHAPVGRHAALEGARLAFGRALEVVPRVEQAAVIAALDCDLLFAEPGALAHARGFARGRLLRGERPTPRMNRLHAVEPSPTITGTSADRRLALPAQAVGAVARALALRLGVLAAAEEKPALPGPARAFVDTLAADLRRAGPRALLVAGPRQPPAVHALVHAIHAALGSLGQTAQAIEPVVAQPGVAPSGAGLPPPGSLEELAAELAAGEVGCLVVLGEDPAFSAPGGLAFAEALGRAELTVHAGLHLDATARRCGWHVPLAHPLEAWGDARAFDGTASLVQPLIAPLYRGRTAQALLGLLGADDALDDVTRVRATWQARTGLAGPELEAWWRAALERGAVAGSAGSPVAARVDREAVRRAAAEAALATSGEGLAAGRDEGPLELGLAPDPTVWDGRHAGNAWLQECPKPLTQLTWSNALWLAPADAARLGLVDEAVARVRWRERSVEAPVLVVPGQAPGTAALTLGYGRDLGPRSAAAHAGGADAYRLRDREARWILPGATVERVLTAAPPGPRELLPGLEPAAARRRGRPRTVELARRQLDFQVEHTHAARSGSLRAFRARPREVALTPAERAERAARARHERSDDEEGEGARRAPPRGHALPTLHLERDPPGPQWGMVIDLTTCIGCNACVVACQAENNVPVVGPAEVRRGRAMHWIRIDSYRLGEDEDAAAVVHQPVPCMHCEHAPCEVVCPTGATQHSEDGLNDMVYNRCVGTRYCSNNCPYRVRRFNFFQYVPEEETLALQRNPDVTVRSRGVMEKCTYCVQRIRAAGIEARREGRAVRDGEVVPACAQACPTRAIVFGDLADPASEVSALRRSPHEYALLRELNTRPRTTYLAAVRNDGGAAREQGS